MATSGVRNFTPTFADMLTHAFSNCEIRPANVVQEHIDEAIRSANLALVSFGNRGVHQYQLIEFSVPLSSGEASYVLPAGTRDVWHAVLRRDGSDTPVWPISRSDYADIPDKGNAGRPFDFTVSNEAVGDAARSITLWPVPDRADTLNLWLWVEPEAVRKMTETMGVGKAWYDAYGWELSWRMALKYAPDKWEALRALAGEAFLAARAATRERRDLRLRGQGYIRRGRVV